MIDFLVIGGGIAGISAAARLSKLGKTVVLEGETALGYHASGRSAAMFEENYGAPTTIALNAASRAFHEDKELLSPRGIMLVGTSTEAEAFEADKKSLKLTDIAVSEAQDMIPILRADNIDRAAYHADAWDIDTDRLLQSFRQMGQENGAQILTGREVTQIRRASHGWQVTTAAETYDAKNIVNAAGAWVDQIADMASIPPLGFTPLRRSMARIAAPGGHDPRNWPMLFGPGEDWYAKPDAGALIVSPAEEDPTTPHDAYADDMTIAEGFARYQPYVTEPVTRPLSTWAGLRTFAPDRNLVLGPDVNDSSFIWCAGQGGYGMQSAPGASQALADIIGGGTYALPIETMAQLSPARFADR
ncbi:FAD-dependent oxidoreductase [Yoonia sp. BS5-3]|uniref:NAD(P)/FAD-dependent oxidoreductase n=1 Tax=Yoonia phaeophyticola TaxID=3137369 RepID=A0ABZ2V3W5_9RHOB